jgi:hypothetical protein
VTSAAGNTRPDATPPASGRVPRVYAWATGPLTVAAAGVATGVAGTGMWKFFGSVLHVDNTYLRAGLFAFLEIALLVSAIRARANLLDDIRRIADERATAEAAFAAAVTDRQRAQAASRRAKAAADRPSTGLDGIAVWVLAASSGVLSALDAATFAETAFRLTAPLVAAWLWERGLAAHRRRHRRGGRIAWRVTPERVLVRWGFADPTGRAVSEVASQREIARLAKLIARYHETPDGRSRRRAARRARRGMERADERFDLTNDAVLARRLDDTLAALYGVLPGTSPAVLAGTGLWGSATRGTPTGTPAEPVREAVSEPLGTPAVPSFNTPAAPLPEFPTHGSDTPVETGSGTVNGTPVRTLGTSTVPGLEPSYTINGSGWSAPPVTSNGTPAGTADDTALLAVLRDPERVPREPGGTVPIKRAMRVLGVGRDRAIRLLDTLSLRHFPDPDDGPGTPERNPGETGSADDQEHLPEPRRINGTPILESIGA